jgi:hypothetical protein
VETRPRAGRAGCIHGFCCGKFQKLEWWAEGDAVRALLRAAGAKWAVKVEGYGKGAPGGPAGNTWTDGDCTAIPLCKAAWDGEARRVGELIADGADVDEQGKTGGTTLMAAANDGQWPCTAIAAALVNTGAQLDLHNKDGVTALMMAVQKGHTAIAEVLVQAGAQTVAREPKEKKLKKKRRVIHYVPPADL